MSLHQEQDSNQYASLSSESHPYKTNNIKSFLCFSFSFYIWILFKT